MENADLLSRYFEEYIRKGFSKIFATQREIAREKIYSKQAYRTDGTLRSRSGMLRQALESPRLQIEGSAGSLRTRVDYPQYIRFLDMKRMGNYRIYNRPIWGILYKETFQNIRYEFGDWLSRQLHEGLTEAVREL